MDPSSPFSGGALLGDRVRCRIMPAIPACSSGLWHRADTFGGLSAATPQALRVLDACGFDVILVETVGVGQSEVEVMGQADTVLVLLAPGTGDAVQVAKAGILEIADIFVVNKADRDGVHNTTRELRSMISIGDRGPDAWYPKSSRRLPHAPKASKRSSARWSVTGRGGCASGDLHSRRLERIRREIEALALDRLRDEFAGSRALAQRVLDGELDPYTAAQSLLD